MRVKLGEKYVDKRVPFTVTSFDISENGDVTMLWDDNKGSWIYPTQLRNSYQRISSEQGESPATDRQQLKAAIALVRCEAHRYLTGLNEFNEFERGLETIEQRASV